MDISSTLWIDRLKQVDGLASFYAFLDEMEKQSMHAVMNSGHNVLNTEERGVYQWCQKLRIRIETHLNEQEMADLQAKEKANGLVE